MGTLSFSYLSGGSVTGEITFRDNNLRLSRFVWNNPTDESGLFRVWKDGALVGDVVIGPQSSDSGLVPGNYSVVEAIDPISGETIYVPEPGLEYAFYMPWGDA